MGVDELIERRWLGGVGTARGEGNQKIAKFGRGRGRKAVIGMRHEIGIRTIRQMELHRNAARARQPIGVGDGVDASKVGEAHGDRDCRPLQMRRFA